MKHLLLIGFALATPLTLAAADRPKAPPAGKAAPSWIEALRDANPARRRQAANSLAKMRPVPPEASGALIAVLHKDGDPTVRYQAAMALGQIRPASPEAVAA